MYQIWLGSEEALEAHHARRNAVTAKFGDAALLKLQCDSDDDDNKYDGFRWPNPVGYEVQDSVAVITVSGGTESATTWLSRLYGIPTYQDIRFRLMEAYEDAQVKSVMLRLDTPGGYAKGAFALSEFIDSYNKKIKPVISFTDGEVASAGVAYGSAAAGIFADQYAMVGSIGAVAVFMEFSQMLKQNGINVKVARSAPYKAVPNRYEKLDEKGEEILNEMVMRGHNQFVDVLSKNIGISVEQINKNIANGKMFTAQEAVSLGLAQGVTTFEKLVATMHAKYQNTTTTAARS